MTCTPGRRGHLWQGRFYSCPLGPSRLIDALAYVDLNPVRASLAERADAYRWSSAAAHIARRDPSGLLDLFAWSDIDRDYAGTIANWAALLASRPLTRCLRREIQAATRHGRPWGAAVGSAAVSS